MPHFLSCQTNGYTNTNLISCVAKIIKSCRKYFKVSPNIFLQGKVIFQHHSPLVYIQLLSPLLTGTPSAFDIASHTVIEQNTSVGSFCSTETLVLRTIQCEQQMSSTVLCPSVTDVLAMSVHDKATGKGDNKLVTMSLSSIQYQIGEYSDTQEWLLACLF